MTLKRLLKLLTSIKEAHPEAETAHVWAVSGRKSLRVDYVGYDQKHKPARIKLEE